MAVERLVVHGAVQGADRPAARRQRRPHRVIIAEMRTGQDHRAVAVQRLFQRGKTGALQRVGLADAVGEFVGGIDLGQGPARVVGHGADQRLDLGRGQVGARQGKVVADALTPTGDGGDDMRKGPAHRRNAALIRQQAGHAHDRQKSAIGQAVAQRGSVVAHSAPLAARASRDQTYSPAATIMTAPVTVQTSGSCPKKTKPHSPAQISPV